MSDWAVYGAYSLYTRQFIEGKQYLLILIMKNHCHVLLWIMQLLWD